MKTITCTWVLLATLATLAAKNEEPLTLERAVGLALRSHPELRELEARIEAASGRALESGAFPNPQAVARFESARSAARAEYVAGISQSLPVGGRLNAAREVENLEKLKLEGDLQRKKVDLRRRVHGAFAAGLFADESFRFHTMMLADAQKRMQIVRAKVDAGDVIPDEAIPFDLQLKRAEAESELTEGLRKKARLALATAMGISEPDFGPLAGSLEEALVTHEIEKSIKQSAQWTNAGEADVAVQRARLKQAKRERIPDVDLDLFYRRLNDERADAIDIGVRVPLPLFNRGRGKIMEAEAEIAAAEARRDQKQNEWHLHHQKMLQALQSSLGRLETYRTALSQGDKMLRTAQARYKAGDISLDEYLWRSQEAANLRSEYLEAIRALVEMWQAF